MCICIILLLFSFLFILGCVYIREYHVLNFINMHSYIFQSLWLQYFLSKVLCFFFLSYKSIFLIFHWYPFTIISFPKRQSKNINHKANWTKYHYKLRWISALFFARHMYLDVNLSMNTEQGYILFISICKENHKIVIL